MKKTSTSKSREKRSDDMQPEYDFDYTKAKPNRFAGRIAKDRSNDGCWIPGRCRRFLPTPSLSMRLFAS